MKYVLHRPTAVAPWVDAMSAHLFQHLGTDRLSQLAISLISSALEPNTYASYGQKIQKFTRFCDEHGLNLLNCQTTDVLRYVAWLGAEGRIAADSVQPYLSAINRLYQDLGLPAIASGPLVVQVVKGLHGMQKPVVTVPLVRSPIPAQVIYDIFASAVHALYSDHCTEPGLLRMARACLATGTAFLFFARPGSFAKLLDADLVITPGPSVCIQLLPRGVKGRARVQPHRLLPLSIPAVAFTNPTCGLAPLDIAGMLARFKQLRNDAFGGQPPQYMWALPGEPCVFGSRQQTAWLEAACLLTCHFPPVGFKWTGHSMRKGAASAASAAGVPFPKICHFGGWAHASKVLVERYIDPTYPASAAGSFFFGWLSQGTYASVAVAAMV